MVEKGSEPDQALGRAIQARLAGKTELRRVDIAQDQVNDPIAKGRLMATLQTARLIVTVGDAATLFAARELPRAPVYFVAAEVPGAALRAPSLSGTFAYSAEDLVEALPAAWRKTLGLVYTPGYEAVAARVRAAAQARGGSVLERRIGRLKELSGAVESLSEKSRAVLVLGDPLLVEGAGLDYLSETLLAKGVALIGAGPEQVLQGAALCSLGRREALAREAAEDLERLAAGEPLEPRLDLAPPGGEILFQPALARRFGLSPKPGWRASR